MSKHTYVAFDADSDMPYYRIMQAWKGHEHIDFDFDNAHDLIKIKEGSPENVIKAALSVRMQQSDKFVLLVGDKTKNLYKYVRWEIETAIGLKLPIIVVNINKKRRKDENLCPPILDNQLAIHISFNKEIIKFAIDNWPSSHSNYASQGKTSWYYYEESIYEKLGLNKTEAEKTLEQLARLRSLKS